MALTELSLRWMKLKRQRMGETIRKLCSSKEAEEKEIKLTLQGVAMSEAWEICLWKVSGVGDAQLSLQSSLLRMGKFPVYGAPVWVRAKEPEK